MTRADATDDRSRSEELTAFGSSEFAKVVLGATLGQAARARSRRRSRPAYAACRAGRAQADPLRARHLRRRHCRRAGAGRIRQRTSAQPSSRIQSLMAHPLFGLFAEPASTVLVTAQPSNVAAIEELADEYSFFVCPHRHHRRQPAGNLGRSASRSSPRRIAWRTSQDPGPNPLRSRLSTTR